MSLEKAQFNKVLGEKIKEIRKTKNITQIELSKIMKLSRVSIVNIERGKQSISIHSLFSLSQKLNMSFSDFIPINEKKGTREYFHEKIDKDSMSKLSKIKIKAFIDKVIE